MLLTKHNSTEKLVINMKLLKKIEDLGGRTTQNEQKLVDYIRHSYPHGMLESATSIARKVGISASTVVRFFAKLGYSSFNEAQRDVRLEIASKLSSPSQRANLTIKHEQSAESALDNAVALDKQNIDAMRSGMDVQTFERIIDLIARQGRGTVYVTAAKNSQAVALYLTTHLNMCVPNVRLLNAGDALLADNLLWVTPNDVLLALSIRRYSRAVLRTAQYFNELGASVVSFTDSTAAPIASISRHNLQIHTGSASPFDSYTSAFCLCNAIVGAVALRHKKETETILERGEHLWKRFDVFAG